MAVNNTEKPSRVVSRISEKVELADRGTDCLGPS
jgi:hypothetical protein